MSEEQNRARFEEWAVLYNYDVSRYENDPRYYFSMKTENVWQAWQAASQKSPVVQHTPCSCGSSFALGIVHRNNGRPCYAPTDDNNPESQPSAQVPDIDAFYQWWHASKYTQVVYSGSDTLQAALDGWMACTHAVAATKEPK